MSYSPVIPDPAIDDEDLPQSSEHMLQIMADPEKRKLMDKAWMDCTRHELFVAAILQAGGRIEISLDALEAGVNASPADILVADRGQTLILTLFPNAA